MGESVKARPVDPSWRPLGGALVTALERRGLVVEATGYGVLRVRNPAGEPDSGDPRGQALAVGLRQEVMCRRREDGVWWWFWVWSGPTRQSAPEVEPMCPAQDTERAAGRIARVLEVPFAESPAPSSSPSGSGGSGASSVPSPSPSSDSGGAAWSGWSSGGCS